MMNFDLSPLIQGGQWRFILRLLFSSLPILVLIHFMGYPDFALSFFRGVVIGTLDTVIMMHGIRKAMPYKDNPKKGLDIMKRYRLYRIISASSLIVLLLKQGSDVAGACLGLLLTHIFLIINLTIIAYRLNKVGNAKKGE